MNLSSGLVIAFFVIWAIGFGCAIIPRLLRLRGKPGGLVEPPSHDLIFDETYASARSHKSTFTRLGSGVRCMRVSVTRDALLVRPHFPFSLVGSDADLVHEIPLSLITDVARFTESGLSGVAVSFGDARRIDIMLKRPGEFLAAVLSGLDEKRPNKAPEPTTTSVMPRANERRTE